MMVSRSEPRQPQQSPVRVFGMDNDGHPVNVSAWTVDVSRHGARVKVAKYWTAPGETIGVRHGLEKARFKIVWVGQDGTPHEGEIGLVCVETGKYIWGIAAPQTAMQEAAAAAHAASASGHFQSPSELQEPVGLAGSTGSANNRRKDARYHAKGGARVQEIGAVAAQWVALHDLSLGGCYVETTAPLPIGTRVDVNVHVGEIQITARGAVTVSHRLVGMGVKFNDLTPLNRARLEQVMAMLTETSTEA